jgi:hypothetical protein
MVYYDGYGWVSRVRNKFRYGYNIWFFHQLGHGNYSGVCDKCWYCHRLGHRDDSPGPE